MVSPYKWLHVSSKFFTTWKAYSLICMSWNGITEWQHLQCVDTHSMWKKCDSWPIFLPYIVKNFHITFMPWSCVALYVSSVVMSLNFLCIICDIHSVAACSIIYFLTNVNIIFCRGELLCMCLHVSVVRNAEKSDAEECFVVSVCRKLRGYSCGFSSALLYCKSHGSRLCADSQSGTGPANC